MSTEEPLRDAPALSGKGKGPRIKQSQQDLVAYLLVEGLPAELIAEKLAVPESGVLRLLKDKGFLEILEAKREKFLRKAVLHRVSLLDMTDRAYAAVERGLVSKDEKLAVDTAFRLFKETDLSGQGEANPSVDVNLSLTQNNTEVTNNFAETVGAFGALFGELLKQEPGKHIREGDEALPKSALDTMAEKRAEAEIIEADFSEPTEPKS